MKQPSRIRFTRHARNRLRRAHLRVEDVVAMLDTAEVLRRDYKGNAVLVLELASRSFTMIVDDSADPWQVVTVYPMRRA